MYITSNHLLKTVMFPIPPKSEIQLIKNLAQESEIRACGFILFTRAHADVIKVLRDPDYWNELDFISGIHWPIFAVKPLEKKAVNSDPQANLEILEYFGLEDSDDTPCFVLFTWDDNDNLVRETYKIPLGSVDIVHNELRDIITSIAKVINQILPDYRRNIETYRLASDELISLRKKRKAQQFFRKAWDTILGIKSVFG